MKTKTCIRCKLAKHVEQFCRHRHMRDGRASVCRSCQQKERATYVNAMTGLPR